jgi:alginate O-acetyltransferase complex protein AlgI
MLFNSLQFCVFFLVVSTLYYLLPWHWRWKMLLLASCVFYMSFIPAYITILASTILIDYFMGIKIAGSSGSRRLFYLQVSIVATCLVLFIFKYYNFFALTVRETQHLLGGDSSFPIAQIILPIGLSFHTFQSLSYVVEVYRGKQKPETNFGIYALYVMFYPQLVAGPIERPQNLLHQFYKEHPFELSNIVEGLRLIAWGFFQKMVIADRSAQYVNRVYGTWDKQSGLSLLAATLLFAVQIYADFSGYSSIAIGCARVMGFKLMTNFNHPYFAKSISEFWKRWHISLSTWFKDYVYIPLGGSRTTISRHYVNLLLTFAISGLWHGANWTFVVWGAYNGVLLVIESALRRTGLRLSHNAFGNAIRRTITLTTICIGWVFFRAANLTQACHIISRIFSDTSFQLASIQTAVLPFTGDSSAFAVGVITCALVIVMFSLEAFSEASRWTWTIHGSNSRLAYQGLSIVALFQIILLFGVLRASAFIYFQF